MQKKSHKDKAFKLFMLLCIFIFTVISLDIYGKGELPGAAGKKEGLKTKQAKKKVPVSEKSVSTNNTTSIGYKKGRKVSNDVVNEEKPESEIKQSKSLESQYGSNTANINIPDTGNWVYSSISIYGAPTDAVVTGIDVHFSCIHPYSGDLDVDLDDASLTRSYDLWANEGAGADNPNRTVYGLTTFNGLPVNGIWYLHAKDTEAQDAGYIDEWWIRIYYENNNQTYSVYANISNLNYGVDADGDGYYETFDFDIAINADVVPDSATIYAKMICNTTGWAWWSRYAWTISGTATDYHYFPFDETDFSNHISGNTNLDFTVELWDSSKSTLLATDTTVTGEPIKADHYIPITYTLNVNVNPSGSGSVAKNPNNSFYIYNELVQLTAVPAAGFEFSGWSGDAVGTSNPTTIAMNSNKNITANFTPITTHTLNVIVNPVGGGNVTKVPDKSSYSHGETVVLIAAPSPYYLFTGWTGDVPGGTPTLVVTMDSSKTITARFTLETYPLTVNVTPVFSGHVDKDPSQSVFEHNAVVKMTAVPATGRIFTGWSGDASGNTNPIFLTMNSAKTVTANFTPITHTLSVNVSPTGGGSVSKNPDKPVYDYGENVEISAVPAPGYTFTHWSGNAGGVDIPVYVTMHNDLTVTANFEGPPPELTVTAPNGGEDWQLGSTQNITWDYANLSGNLKITLWKDGSAIATIATDIDPSLNAYQWSVGNHLGGTVASGAGYAIKIKEIGTAIEDNSDAPFTISDSQTPSLTVTAPNGGEDWELGTTQNITWDYTNLSANLKITLWKDGSAIATIATDIDPSLNAYQWSVGNHLGGTVASGAGYTIKIKEIGTAVEDNSDAAFTISDSQTPSITVTSPNGGEGWGLGSTQNITWNPSGLSSPVKITLWKDGGLIGTIAKNIAPSTSSYSWIVGYYIGGTAATGTGYTIKIKEIGTAVADTSDTAFTISESPTPMIRVTTPNGGEDWELGATQNITWIASNISANLKITLLKDGVVVGTIATDVAPSPSYYEWTVGNHAAGTAAVGTGYTIKIKEVGTAVVDFSDASFTISENSGTAESIDALLADAKFVLKVNSGSIVDLDALLTNNSSYAKTRIDSYAYWEKDLNQFNYTTSKSHKIAGLETRVVIKIAVNENGMMYVGSFGDDSVEHLTLFSGTRTGMVNYTDFDGSLLSQNSYRSVENFYVSNNLKQNRLGCIMQNEYANLYNNNYITGGPQNNAEFCNLKFALKNNMGQKVIIVKSFLLHQQFDDSRYNEKVRPIDSEQNAIWSPIAGYPDQDMELQRSFDITYLDPVYSSLFIETITSIDNHSGIIVAGINNARDYTSSGTYPGFGSWGITYNPANGTYKVENQDFAGVSLQLRNQCPDSVTMKGRSTCANYRQVFVIAVIGGDILTANHQESPYPGDGNNPAPVKLVIMTGWNTH